MRQAVIAAMASPPSSKSCPALRPLAGIVDAGLRRLTGGAVGRAFGDGERRGAKSGVVSPCVSGGMGAASRAEIF